MVFLTLITTYKKTFYSVLYVIRMQKVGIRPTLKLKNWIIKEMVILTFKKGFYSVLYFIWMWNVCIKPTFKFSDSLITGMVLFCSEPRTYKVNLKIIKWSTKVLLIRVTSMCGSLKTSKFWYVSVAVWANDELVRSLETYRKSRIYYNIVYNICNLPKLMWYYSPKIYESCWNINAQQNM